MKKITILASMALAAMTVSAQYPVIPDSVKARGAALQAEWDALSDAAWEKALPIINKEEAEKGRPYRPWASKPEDLIRADIKAFPGAEGGGAYTPGGRDGKVF
ncbi:MAG: polysaccharide lyase, partial [Duncaniella sp.]|nr:polysaccharide lyase [Duncaniella sp.]